MKDIKMTISAFSTFLPDQSVVENQRYLWSYEITIANDSEEIIQLLNRYWRITDMTSHVEEVRGPGVVGLQPLIKPGKKFSYTSFCQLVTPQGTMEGQYEMQTLEETRFFVPIPKFVLAASGMGEGWRGRLH
jgi:ApaG protein